MEGLEKSTHALKEVTVLQTAIVICSLDTVAKKVDYVNFLNYLNLL